MAGTIPKMKDVAVLAGVSIKTVSRVLNNEPHVQEAVRKKVRDAAQTLNYVPSKSARSLRGRRSYNINMLCHSARSNYVNAIQFGAVMACQAKGYQLTISLLDELEGKSVGEVKAAIEKLATHMRPDGVLLVAPLASDPVVNAALKELGIPVACIGPTDIPDAGVQVEINDRAAAREMTEYLLSLGHERIAFVRGKEEQGATEERFRGYSAALRAAGLAVDPEIVCSGRFDFKSGLSAGAHLLALERAPTAVFAANDDMAAGVLMAANQHNVQVPSELSIVGFDDSEIAEKIWPALTTIRQPLLQLGEIAILNLIDALGPNGSEEANLTRLPHELIVRESSGKIASRAKRAPAAKA